jgi:ELWxxDGT repeat protein
MAFLFINNIPGRTTLNLSNATSTSINTLHTFNFIDETSAILGGKVVFFADDGLHGTELWSTDGSAAGTKLVKDIDPGLSGQPPSFSGGSTGNAMLGNKLVFMANSASTGKELWITDGTAAGTKLVKDIEAGAGSSTPENFITIGSKVVFTAKTAADGQELWVTDGTAAGTKAIATLPGFDATQPRDLAALGGKVYFSANDAAFDNELWVTDGTATGTHRVTDIAPGFSSRPKHLTVLGDKIIFGAIGPTSNGEALFISDGTAAGTKLLKDLPSNPGIGTNIDDLRQVSSKIYFRETDETGKPGLWVTDGTATGTFKLHADLNFAHGTAAGSKFVFAADDHLRGTEIWVSDGTVAGTHILKDILPGAAGSRPFDLQTIGNKVYFSAKDGTHGLEMWVTDGTSAGTKLVKDLTPGADGYFGGVLSDFPTSPGAPTKIALSSNSIKEFRASGTIVGKLLATDPTPGDSFTYKLTDGAGGRFKLVGDKIEVKNGLLLDYELQRSHIIRVQVTDKAGHTFELLNVAPETITGDASNNRFVGGLGTDTLKGLGGNDQLGGERSADKLYGGSGNDILSGGAGADILSGGTGTDTASYYSDLGSVKISLDGSITATGTAKGDKLTSIENLLGTKSGDDTLVGNGGKNYIYGYSGNDTIKGRNGDDQLRGGFGADTLTGGGGNDQFIYKAPFEVGDTITDFTRGDKFVFEGSQFELGTYHGPLPSGAFAANKSGHTALLETVHFIFDQSTDQLWFDFDGSGPLEAKMVADLNGAKGFNLGFADILVV